MEIELNFVVLKLVNTLKKVQKKMAPKKKVQKKKVEKTMLLLFDDN